MSERQQQTGTDAPGAGGDRPDDSSQAARIRELEAEVRRLEQENARLGQAAETKDSTDSKDSRFLGHQEILGKLEEASLPMREKIKSLYQIEKASIQELTIPEAPYSCVIRLDLLNLATQAREEVDVSAAANIKGEWSFPSIEQIARGVRPRGQTPPRTAASAGATPTGPARERDALSSGNQRQPASTPASPSPAPGRKVPPTPIPGEEAGITILRWETN